MPFPSFIPRLFQTCISTSSKGSVEKLYCSLRSPKPCVSCLKYVFWLGLEGLFVCLFVYMTKFGVIWEDRTSGIVSIRLACGHVCEGILLRGEDPVTVGGAIPGQVALDGIRKQVEKAMESNLLSRFLPQLQSVPPGSHLDSPGWWTVMWKWKGNKPLHCREAFGHVSSQQGESKPGS